METETSPAPAEAANPQSTGPAETSSGNPEPSIPTVVPAQAHTAVRTVSSNESESLELYQLKIVLDFYLKTYQLIFLSETWFIDHDQICQHPNFVTHIPLSSFHANRHQTGGMALFCSNSARAQLSSTRCTSNTILACCASLYFLGIYFEPSLPEERYNTSSSHTPRLTLFLYGPHWGGLTTGSRPRHAVVSLYCATFDLVHTKPTGFCPRNDHVYTCAQLSVVYSAEPAVIASDHHCLLVEIAPSHTTDAAPAFGLERYHLCCLDNPRVSALLRGAFGVIAPLLIDALSTATHSIASLSAPGRQCLVDELDAQVLSAVSECCSTALDTYQVSKIVVSTALTSRDPSIEATEDAALYFKSVFAQPDSSLRGVSAAVQQCHRTPCPEIVEFFSADNVCKYIKRYPSTVPCSSDSIHGHILKALLPTKVDKVLSLLFTLCVMTGVTPACWNMSIVCLIPKKQTSVHIDSFRPIALTEMFHQMFEKCLLWAFERFFSLCRVANCCPTQAGFCKGFSTQSHALYSHELCV
ncbi:hypothetical protein DSO57_1025815 [Entomophthora muscae]|uniref:Uncharacterized protein n=1 Tax=Entomophthora muscae TaxID=34485 RepID=A0ACC2TDK9_9FUNG|nr:hypothetical protein DSO57_1025815 [Entomophthora muscae]